MEQEYKAHSLRDFLTVLFKHKQKILIVFLVTVMTVTTGSFLLPPTFEASSSLMIKFGREYIYRSEVDDTRPSISFNQEESINSEIEILKSRGLIEKVISTLGVERVYPRLAENSPGKISPLDAAVLKFEKALSVESVKKSNVIEVSLQHGDPQTAAVAVNLLVDCFKEKHLQVFSDPKTSFMEKQLQIYREKLKESEDSLEAFKKEHGIVSIDEQRRLILNQRVDLDTSLKNAENRTVELVHKLSSLKEQIATVKKTIPLYQETEGQKILDDAKAKLLALQLREQELLANHNETSRLVINVRKEIALVKKYLTEQEKSMYRKVRTGKNEIYQQIEMQKLDTEAGLTSLRARTETIREQIADLDANLQNLELREKELQNLKRELSINETTYQTYVKKMEEARITDDLNRQKMVSISVIQEAIVPVKPVKPRKALNILLAIVLGSVSGLGLAFSSEFVSQGIATPETAEKQLDLPVIATVPYKDDLEKTVGEKKRGKGQIVRLFSRKSKEH